MRVLGKMIVLMCGFAGVSVAQPAVMNGGFEQGVSSWKIESRFQVSFIEPTHGGTGSAVFGVRPGGKTPDLNASGTLSQSVRIGSAPVSLTFWGSIATAETDGRVHDKLMVEIADVSGVPIETKRTLSNLDHSAGYVRYSYVLRSVNRTVRIQFRGTTDGANGTIFRIDDVSLTPLTTFRVVVTDADTGAPLPHAKVAWSGVVDSQETGPDGSCVFTAAPCVSGVLSVTVDRYQPMQTAYAPGCAGANTKSVVLHLLPTILTGHVLDSELKEAIAGAVVIRGTERTVTSSDGSYAFVLPNCAPAMLSVTAPRFGSFQQPSSLTCGVTNTQDVLLSSLKTNVSIIVASEGRPVEGVQVRLSGAPPISQYQSLFSYQGITCGAQILAVTAPGFTPIRISYTPACDVSNLTTVNLQPIVTVVAGTISDHWSRSAVNKAIVSLDGVSTTTGPDGRFTLPGRRCLSSLFKVTAPGYQPSIERYTPSCDHANVKDSDLTSAPSGTAVCGLVTETQTGDPISQVPVQFGTSAAIMSDDHGGYCLAGIGCASNTLRARKDAYGELAANYSPVCGKTNVKDIQLAAQMIVGRVVDGSVRYGTIALSIPEANATYLDRSTRSNANGDIRFSGVCGNGLLRISKAGYATYERPEGVACGLGPAVSEGTRPLIPAGTNLYIIPTSHWGALTFGGRVGTPTTEGFLLADVPCERAILTVSAPYFETGRLGVTPVCAKSTIIFAPVQRIATDITGTVSDGLTGQKISGAVVTFGDLKTTTASNGTYKFAMTRCGTATFAVRSPGYRDVQESFSASCVTDNRKDVTLAR
jgi:hypothetical protein